MPPPKVRSTPTVALLLDKGADPNISGRKGVTPLIAAAFKGNARVFEMLLARGADPKASDETGKSAMVYAAARGFDDIVKRLIDSGVDPRARYGNDLTALMWAAGHEDGVGAAAVARVIDLLLAHGAEINAADNRGRTALMIAASVGDAATVELLLKRGADRSVKDKDGKSALDLGGERRRARQACGGSGTSSHPCKPGRHGGNFLRGEALHEAAHARIVAAAPLPKSVIVFCR